MKMLAYVIRNVRAWIEKNPKMSQGQRSKHQKLWITSSVIVTDIPIKPQQFPTSSYWVARYSFRLPRPWPWTHDLETKPSPRYSEDVSPKWKWSYQVKPLERYILNWRSTKIAQGQGQRSTTCKYFWRSSWDKFLQSYINFSSVVLQISWGQTDRQMPPKAILAGSIAGMQVTRLRRRLNKINK